MSIKYQNPVYDMAMADSRYDSITNYSNVSPNYNLYKKKILEQKPTGDPNTDDNARAIAKANAERNSQIQMLNEQRAAQERRHKEQLAAIERKKQEQTQYLTGQKENQLKGYEQKYNDMVGYIDEQHNKDNEVLSTNREENLQSSYISNELAKQSMPQQQVAMGNTGGLSESSAIAQNASYETGKNKTQQYYGRLLSDLQSQTSKSKLNAKSTYADTVSSVEQYYADALNKLENESFDVVFNMQNAYAEKADKLESQLAEKMAQANAASQYDKAMQKYTSLQDKANKQLAIEDNARAAAVEQEKKMSAQIKAYAREMGLEGLDDNEILREARIRGKLNNKRRDL